MKALAFALALSSPAFAFDNVSLGTTLDVAPVRFGPKQEQMQKCYAQFPEDFCRDTASMSTPEQFELILEKLHAELTAHNIQF